MWPDEHADVVIIGGGIVGCATAYYLAKRRAKVVLVEKGEIGGGQSSRAWGFVRQQGRDPREMPLMLACSRMWPNLSEELNADIEWVQGGNLVLAADEQRMHQLEEWRRSRYLAEPTRPHIRALHFSGCRALVRAGIFLKAWAGPAVGPAWLFGLCVYVLTKSYVSELERGHRTPRITTLKILARRLNRPLSYFLDGVTGDRESEAFLAVGLAYLHADDVVEAAAWLDRAREAAALDGDEVSQARVELALAYVDQRLGHDLRAWRRIERVLPVLAQNGGRPTLVRAHTCLGRSKLAAGDPASAAWTFEAALELLPENDPSPAATLHYYLGVARERLGQSEEAVEAFRKALEVAVPLADPQRAGAWHIDRAAAAADGGCCDDAIAYAGEALAIYETCGHKRRLAEIHWQLGDIEARAGRWEEAQRHYWTSIAAYGAAGYARGATRTLGGFVEALLTRAPREAVQAIGETVLALFPNDGGVAGARDDDRASKLWLRGTVYRVLGRTDDARATLMESLRLLEGLQRPDEARTVRRELALLALEANDLAAAREHLTMLRDVSDRSHVPKDIPVGL